jgi:hypothetical protein
VSREAFADFSLVFEWRLAPGGNSGVLYRVSEDADAPWQSGLEMQLLDDAGHPDGRVPETRCGALYGLYPREMDATCPPGAYNEGRIRVRGNEVEHWLNGTCVLRFEIGAEPFLQRLGRSKFAHCPLFAKQRKSAGTSCCSTTATEPGFETCAWNENQRRVLRRPPRRRGAARLYAPPLRAAPRQPFRRMGAGGAGRAMTHSAGMAVA